MYTVSRKGRHQTHGSNPVKPSPILFFFTDYLSNIYLSIYLECKIHRGSKCLHQTQEQEHPVTKVDIVHPNPPHRDASANAGYVIIK